MDTGSARRRYQSPLRHEQQRATRDRILEALADVLTEHGSATVPQVAARAGVSERTVYRHFPTREQLYSALFTWVIRRDTTPSAETVDDLVGFMREMFGRFGERPEVIRAMNTNELGRDLRSYRAAYRRQAVVDALASSLADVDEGTGRKATAAAQLLTSSTAFLYLRDFWEMSADEAADVVEWAVRSLIVAAQDGGEHGRRRARVGRTRTR
jgi:AcrR family transcriptional regulator